MTAMVSNNQWSSKRYRRNYDINEKEKTKQMKKEGEDNVGGRWLPADLVIELLARLPVKSLCQLKCVAKDWCSVTGDPKFIEVHRSYNRTAGLLISIPEASKYSSARKKKQHECFYYSSLRVGEPEEFVCRLTMPMPSSTGLGYKGFTHVVKGLFGFYGHNNGAVSVCNITTGEIMNMPNDDSQNDAISTDYRLGFDPVNEVYKLLKICTFRRHSIPLADSFDQIYHSSRCFFHNFDDSSITWRNSCISHSYRRECKVLTLGQDSTWRKLPGDGPASLHNQSIYVNGVLHWMSFCPQYEWTLISFDLNKEVFRFVKIPPKLASSFSRTTHRLAQFKGNLALTTTCVVENTECFLLYTLDDEEGHAWTSHTIPLPRELTIADAAGTVSLGNLPTGEILLANPKYKRSARVSSTPVYSYSHRDKKFERFVVGMFPPILNLRYRYGFAFQISCMEESFAPLDVLFGAGSNRTIK